jgi:hypothetical protein
MVTRNFDTPANYSSGEPIIIMKKGNETPATFKDLAVIALSGSYSTDGTLAAGALYDRGKLADAIDAGGNVEISVTDIMTIREFVSKAWPVRVIATIYDYLEKDLITTTTKGE